MISDPLVSGPNQLRRSGCQGQHSVGESADKTYGADSDAQSRVRQARGLGVVLSLNRFPVPAYPGLPGDWPGSKPEGWEHPQGRYGAHPTSAHRSMSRMKTTKHQTLCTY